MKTAMQELIEYVDNPMKSNAISKLELVFYLKNTLLEKEKEQIKDAYHKGGYLLTKKPYGVFVEEVEEYYNESYNQNK